MHARESAVEVVIDEPINDLIPNVVTNEVYSVEDEGYMVITCTGVL